MIKFQEELMSGFGHLSKEWQMEEMERMNRFQEMMIRWSSK
jgi:hypothetical protein